MLQITVPASESWNYATEEFTKNGRDYDITLEHSLVSISKWESKWQKPFLSTATKTSEEVIDYVRCMTITQNVPSYVYENLTVKNLDDIEAYISSPMTATKVRHDKNGGKSREVITNELIYYWMISYNIPFECKTWHLNRLLTLIDICNVKNAPQKKMSQKELLARNASVNDTNKKFFKTKG